MTDEIRLDEPAVADVRAALSSSHRHSSLGCHEELEGL